MNPTAILILAAGKGTRMRSQLPKVLHPLAGRPLLAHVLATARALQPERLVVVIGHQAERIREALDAQDIQWVQQHEQLGTAHAVQCALPALAGLTGPLLILNGDVPLIQEETLRELIREHQRQQRAVTLLSTTVDPPTGYGRVVRDEQGRLLRIVEEKDAHPRERAIREINSGTYCIALERLENWLQRIDRNNTQGEYYLTDLIALAKADEQIHGGTGEVVAACHHSDHLSLAGINSRGQLAELEKAFRDRRVHQLMESGVTFQDPSSCWLAADAVIQPDTTIAPQVILGPGVVIESGCTIGPFCEIRHSHIGPGSEILAFCHLDGVQVKGPNIIGPYARLRPGTILEPRARIGNFCELKKAHVGEGSKINHLSYIGDAQVGKAVNIGAGTITCNYDGVHKHQTIFEDGVFVGSGTQLVAPVRVGASAFIGAGTTVTEDVPSQALALSRHPQENTPEWAIARRQKESH